MPISLLITNMHRKSHAAWRSTGYRLVCLMFLMPALGPHGQLILIAVSAIGFDLGLQSSLVAHQNLVYSLSLRPGAS